MDPAVKLLVRSGRWSSFRRYQATKFSFEAEPVGAPAVAASTPTSTLREFVIVRLLPSRSALPNPDPPLTFTASYKFAKLVQFRAGVARTSSEVLGPAVALH